MLFNSLAQAVGSVELIVIFAIILIALIPVIFYLLTLQKALDRCAIENRAMSPGMVWLLFIPLFNLFWHFMIVIKLAQSLDNEFQSRNIQSDPMPGKSLGIAMCVLAVCSIIPLVGSIASLGQLVCWIIYWVKIAGYSKLLVENYINE